MSEKIKYTPAKDYYVKTNVQVGDYFTTHYYRWMDEKDLFYIDVLKKLGVDKIIIEELPMAFYKYLYNTEQDMIEYFCDEDNDCLYGKEKCEEHQEFCKWAKWLDNRIEETAKVIIHRKGIDIYLKLKYSKDNEGD